MNTSPGTVGSDPVILATAGYDHTVRFWQAHSGICTRTVQHQDSQVNALEITPDRSMIAAAGYQHIRMYDLNSNNPNPIISYDGVNKNIASVGFHEDGRWMYTGGEDCTARIWDLRSRNLQCQRIFQVNAPINCVCLHPNQAELIVGDQSGAIHIWDLKTDHNEQLIPEPEVSITSAHIDPDASYMAAVNSTGNCYVWNLTGGIGDEVTQLIPKTKIPAHTRYALQCRFSPDSTLLATCSADQTCKIWRTSNFSLMTELSIKSSNPGESSRGWMWGCAFSGDSQYIVTAPWRSWPGKPQDDSDEPNNCLLPSSVSDVEVRARTAPSPTEDASHQAWLLTPILYQQNNMRSAGFSGNLVQLIHCRQPRPSQMILSGWNRFDVS
ncbi:target of rapamycin complex subunit LST8 isoform 1-T2 [Callospermophilus lateralis]|uniref:target of rapamycin complex subunit LST8 isoform X1 n=1 Tax=Callospermophilus lateralis TaxID=76772 RepID=UPI004038CED2